MLLGPTKAIKDRQRNHYTDLGYLDQLYLYRSLGP